MLFILTAEHIIHIFARMLCVIQPVGGTLMMIDILRTNDKCI